MSDRDKFKTPPIVFALEEKVKDLEGKIAKAVEALKLIGGDGQYINAELQSTGSPYHGMNEKEIADKVLLEINNRNGRDI